jgi:hypothetical protein
MGKLVNMIINEGSRQTRAKYAAQKMFPGYKNDPHFYNNIKTSLKNFTPEEQERFHKGGIKIHSVSHTGNGRSSSSHGIADGDYNPYSGNINISTRIKDNVKKAPTVLTHELQHARNHFDDSYEKSIYRDEQDTETKAQDRILKLGNKAQKEHILDRNSLLDTVYSPNKLTKKTVDKLNLYSRKNSTFEKRSSKYFDTIEKIKDKHTSKDPDKYNKKEHLREIKKAVIAQTKNKKRNGKYSSDDSSIIKEYNKKNNNNYTNNPSSIIYNVTKDKHGRPTELGKRVQDLRKR